MSMSEEERVKYFIDSLMKAVEEGVRVEDIVQDIKCVEGNCDDCHRCVGGDSK